MVSVGHGHQCVHCARTERRIRVGKHNILVLVLVVVHIGELNESIKGMGVAGDSSDDSGTDVSWVLSRVSVMMLCVIAAN